MHRTHVAHPRVSLRATRPFLAGVMIAPISPVTARSAAVLVNADAGAVLQMGADHFAKTIEDAFGKSGITADVHVVKARNLRRELMQCIGGAYDLVVVSGGDGTASEMLPQLIAAPMPVAILPLGTLNLLASDLGLVRDVAGNIAAIADGRAVFVDVGTLNSKPFHSISGLGFFGMMARERERARRRFPFSKSLGFLWAALRTLLFSRTMHVDITADGKHRQYVADAVLVTNNRFEGTPWRRAALDGGKLEVHMFEAKGLSGRLRAVLAVARGRWRDLPNLETIECEEVVLNRRKRKRMLVSTDGELRLMRGPLRYAILPRALRVLGAQPEQA